MRVLTVGHVTNDFLNHAVHPGGAALYAGLAAVALGAEVTLFSRAGPDFVGRHLLGQFHRVELLDDACTTTFDERYVGAQRIARLLARAGPISPPLPSADVVLLCPVTDEVPPSALTVRPGRLLAAGLQGWLRAFAPDGSSTPRPLLDARAFAGCDLVCCSAEDLFGLGPETLDALRATVPNVAVTDGAAGARLYAGAEEWHVAPLSVDAVDPTGAGDVFLATLALQLGRGAPLLEAGTWAACAGALTVTAVGPSGLGQLKELPEASPPRRLRTGE
jgi:sugar/nucleoside kinase (ribokinase family)